MGKSTRSELETFLFRVPIISDSSGVGGGDAKPHPKVLIC